MGSRSIMPEHDGQESGDPFRSFAMRFRACAGLYEAGRGLRIYTPGKHLRARPRRLPTSQVPIGKLIDLRSNSKPSFIRTTPRKRRSVVCK